jgi:mRNA interferase HicA
LLHPDRPTTFVLQGAGTGTPTAAGKTGRAFEAHKGGSGHGTVIRDGHRSQLPIHGSNKELGAGLVNKIKEDLGFD